MRGTPRVWAVVQLRQRPLQAPPGALEVHGPSALSPCQEKAKESGLCSLLVWDVGGPSKGACSWAGWLPSCRAIPRRSCICEQTAATTPAVGNTRASVLKEQSGDGTSIYSTIQNSAKCGGDIFLLINCPSFMIQYFPLFLGCTLFDYFFVCQHF